MASKSDIRLRFSSFEAFWEASHERLETFESAVDLFTILSLVFIIASFAFGIQQVERAHTQKAAKMSFEEVAQGTGTAVGLPEEQIALIVKKEKTYEFITFVKGGEEPKIIYRSDWLKSLRDALEGERHEFEKAEKLFLIHAKDRPEDYSTLFLKVQEWMVIYYSQQSFTVCFQ